MLNKIFLFLLPITIGCQSVVQVNPDDHSDQPNTTILTTAKTDTMAPKIVAKPRMTVDRSRSMEEIDQTFPFNIPLERPDGKMTSSDLVIPNNGKPTVVMFWLTTCYPCRLEMKAITQKYAYWKEEVDFNIVAISTDWDKNAEQFSKMSKSEGWPWESYRDLNREFRKILPGGLNGLPQTFIFDKKGEIAYHSRKYRQGDEDKLFNAIKAAHKI